MELNLSSLFLLVYFVAYSINSERGEWFVFVCVSVDWIGVASTFHLEKNKDTRSARLHGLVSMRSSYREVSKPSKINVHVLKY